MSVNKAIIVGRLGRDPEMRSLSEHAKVCSFSVATDREWKDKNGEKHKETDWHRCVAFGRTGEVCGEYLHKGSQVYIEGRMELREWETKDGEKRSATQIVVETMKMIGDKRASGADSSDGGYDPFDGR